MYLLSYDQPLNAPHLDQRVLITLIATSQGWRAKHNKPFNSRTDYECRTFASVAPGIQNCATEYIAGTIKCATKCDGREILRQVWSGLISPHGAIHSDP